jgi:hypothetical protein
MQHAEFNLAIDLENIKKLTINEVFEDEGLVMVGSEEDDTYYVIDCLDHYREWWTKNKANDEDFVNEVQHQDDGYTSNNRYLDESINIFKVADFQEYVRFYSNWYTVKHDLTNLLDIELNQLITDLTSFKHMNINEMPRDYRVKYNTILLICRNIGGL